MIGASELVLVTTYILGLVLDFVLYLVTRETAAEECG
jgi:hypothetical protein